MTTMSKAERDRLTRIDADSESPEGLDAAGRLFDDLFGHDGFTRHILQDELPPTCPVCLGPGCVLGTLGEKVWLRCRDCGMDFSEQADPDPLARHLSGACGGIDCEYCDYDDDGQPDDLQEHQDFAHDDDPPFDLDDDALWDISE